MRSASGTATDAFRCCSAQGLAGEPQADVAGSTARGSKEHMCLRRRSGVDISDGRDPGSAGGSEAVFPACSILRAVTLFSARQRQRRELLFSATPSAQVPAAPRWLRAVGPSPLAAAASAFAIAPMASSCSAEPVLSCLITLRSSSSALSTTHYSVGGEKTLNTGMPGAGPYSAPINTPPSRPKPASWCSPGSTTTACSSPPRTSRPNEAASGAPGYATSPPR